MREISEKTLTQQEIKEWTEKLVREANCRSLNEFLRALTNAMIEQSDFINNLYFVQVVANWLEREEFANSLQKINNERRNLTDEELNTIVLKVGIMLHLEPIAYDYLITIIFKKKEHFSSFISNSGERETSLLIISHESEAITKQSYYERLITIESKNVHLNWTKRTISLRWGGTLLNIAKNLKFICPF